jgi:hypothetical protein
MTCLADPAFSPSQNGRHRSHIYSSFACCHLLSEILPFFYPETRIITVNVLCAKIYLLWTTALPKIYLLWISESFANNKPDTWGYETNGHQFCTYHHRFWHKNFDNPIYEIIFFDTSWAMVFFSQLNGESTGSGILYYYHLHQSYWHRILVYDTLNAWIQHVEGREILMATLHSHLPGTENKYSHSPNISEKPCQRWHRSFHHPWAPGHHASSACHDPCTAVQFLSDLPVVLI